MSYGNSFTEIDFTSHKMTIISGKNGSGKTCMLEALSFALFGIPYRNINKPNLINSVNGKELLTEIEFQIGKKNYLVKRGIKPTIFEIYVDGTLVDQDSKSKDYQKYLEQNILKLNYKSFTQLVMLGSSDFIPFMLLPAQERREVIEELLDIRVFSRMNLVLKEKISLVKEKNKSLTNEIEIVSNKIKLQKDHISKLKSYSQEIVDANMKEIVEYETLISNLNKNLESLKSLKSEKSLSIKDCEDVKNKYADAKKAEMKIQLKISKLNSSIKFYKENGTCTTCNQQISDDFKHSCIEQNLQELEITKQTEVKLKSLIEKLQNNLNQIEKINSEILNLDIQIMDSYTQIEGAEKYILKLKNINQTKGNAVSEEDSNLLKTSEKELEDLQHQKDENISQLDYYDVCSELLKDNGIKTKIIKQYLPLMNKYINRYLNGMDFFVNFNLDENFKEVIKSRHRDEFQYESFSQGEKFRIDMSLLLTWREISRKRNSTSTNILIMDEVFDSSLDGTGTEEFLRLLTNLSKKVHIFVISHKPDVISHKFDRHLKAEKKNNFSTLS